jgi:hypothetical protein
MISSLVIPGKRSATRNPEQAWIPAFAGMTVGFDFEFPIAIRPL